jgi:hypothetical protein
MRKNAMAVMRSEASRTVSHLRAEILRLSPQDDITTQSLPVGDDSREGCPKLIMVRGVDPRHKSEASNG